MHKTTVWLLSFALVWGVCMTVSSALPQTLQPTTVMVVYIHGTSDPFFFSRTTLREAYSSKRYSALSFYARYCYLMRERMIFPGQPIQGVGLQSLDHDAKKLHAPLMSRSCHEQFKALYGDTKKVALYSFGWSGQLDGVVRQYAAEQLYGDLVAERTRREALGEKVELHIIGHSHGATIGALLAFAEEKQHKGLIVEKLIAAGMPVHEITHIAVRNPMFKAIYNIYSSGDSMQPLDYISSQGFICGRLLDQTTDRRVINCKVTVNQQSPSHFVLGLVGYAGGTHYPQAFPLYPLPVTAFSPLMTAAADPFLGHLDHAAVSITVEGNKGSVVCAPMIALQEPVQSLFNFDLPITFATKPFEEKANKCYQSFYTAGRVWYLAEER